MKQTKNNILQLLIAKRNLLYSLRETMRKNGEKDTKQYHDLVVESCAINSAIWLFEDKKYFNDTAFNLRDYIDIENID